MGFIQRLWFIRVNAWFVGIVATATLTDLVQVVTVDAVMIFRIFQGSVDRGVIQLNRPGLKDVFFVIIVSSEAFALIISFLLTDQLKLESIQGLILVERDDEFAGQYGAIGYGYGGVGTLIRVLPFGGLTEVLLTINIHRNTCPVSIIAKAEPLRQVDLINGVGVICSFFEFCVFSQSAVTETIDNILLAYLGSVVVLLVQLDGHIQTVVTVGSDQTQFGRPTCCCTIR